MLLLTDFNFSINIFDHFLNNANYYYVLKYYEECGSCSSCIPDDMKFLSTHRVYGKFMGLWEFPGGKIEVMKLM